MLAVFLGNFFTGILKFTAVKVDRWLSLVVCGEKKNLQGNKLTFKCLYVPQSLNALRNDIHEIL